MKHLEHEIVFEPAGRHVFALPGTVLLEAAAGAGLVLQTPCGGAGTCGKCRLRVTSGDCPPSSTCRKLLSKGDVRNGFRLACQARIQGDLVVEIPDSALFETQQQILVKDSGETFDIQPAISKIYVELTMPDQGDSRSDVERLRNATHPVSFGHIGIHTLRLISEALRKASYKGTAVIVDHELIDFEPGNTMRQNYGVAFDVGTTTIVGTLVDLSTGTGVAIESGLNPQTSYGDDVITRIQKCREDHKYLVELQQAVIGYLNDMIEKLAKAGRIRRSAIYEIVLAGNTTMQQIACGINPSALGELPFVPVFRDALQIRASDLDLKIHRNGRVYVFPQIGGFVGGDTVAGILASRLDRMSSTVLFVDVGTNGEIVLAHDGKLMATSVAAGPAFEGARISCGMRATSGAIEKVMIDDDVYVNVIGNVQPTGLCGSGLIDAVAELLNVGVLDATGRVLSPEEAPGNTPEAVRERLVTRDGHVDFILVQESETATGKALVLSQRDIRELQLANAAIRAGINILLQMEGLKALQLDYILLAGAFGNFIRRNHAQRIGLLPAVPRNRIRFIGNASSLGAKRSLLSVAEKQYAGDIARKTRHVDLSLSPEFQMEFGSAMIFPPDDPVDSTRETS